MNISRRSLIGGAAMAVAAPLVAEPKKDSARSALQVYEPQIAHDAPPRNRHPYAGVDFATAHYVTTTTHGHIDNQEMLDVYLRHKFGFLTISNYYPSAPRYPGKDFTRDHYVYHTDYPLIRNGRRFKPDGPIDWNRELASVRDQMHPSVKDRFPFDPKRDERLFPNWPQGILEAPNAEHFGFYYDDGGYDRNVHLCAPGSFYRSGVFDKGGKFGVQRLGYGFSCGEHWRTATDRMIKELMFPDGGGVTINHPTWSNIDRTLLLAMLDHDPRILGLEAQEGNGIDSTRYWDWVLATGRQCFGFFVPDWGYKNRDFGANVLLVPELTAHACLKAYRQGNFYGSKHAMDELRFTSIACDGKTVSAATDKPAKFQVITARGVVQEATGTSVSWTVPQSDATFYGAVTRGPAHEVYARIKATAADGCGEELYSQAFMLV